MRLAQRFPVVHLVFEASEYKGPVVFRYIRALFLTPYYTTLTNATHRRWYRFSLRYRLRSTRLILWAANRVVPTPDIAEVLLKAPEFQEEFLDAIEKAAFAELAEAFEKLRQMQLEGEQWLLSERARLTREQDGRTQIVIDRLKRRMLDPKHKSFVEKEEEEEKKKALGEWKIPQALLMQMEREARLAAKKKNISDSAVWEQTEIKRNLTTELQED